MISLVTTQKLVAQGNSSFCSNTALVPVFKQDFGVGVSSTSTTTAPLGSTNYNFGGVGTDGNYIVTPKIENANKSDWTKGGDHTGNPNGNLFLVNAGGNRSIFLQQNVSGLCSGSNYSFTAWLANVNTWSTKNICGAGLVYPKITFNIRDLSNNLLATYTTDTLPLSPVNGPAKWIKYGFQFSLPTNITSLKLEIVDYRGGGAACGNDVALDDILFEACVPQISVSLNGNADVCVGDSGKLQTTLLNSPYTNPAYLWQKSKDGGTTWDDLTAAPNDSSLYIFNNVVPANSGLYRVLVAPTAANIFNAYCSAISNTVYYSVNNLPILQPSTNAPICSGNTLILTANASGGSGVYSSYQWTGPTLFSSAISTANRTNMKTTDSGSYQITISDSKGCKAKASLYVFVDSTPVLSTIAVTDTICSGTLASASFKSSINTSAFYWNAAIVNGSITGAGAIINPEYTGQKSAVLTNTGINPATIQYSVYAKNNNCVSNAIDTTITILPLNSIANAGNDTSICSAQPIQLNASEPPVGIGEWAQISGPSNLQINDPKNAKSIIQNLQPGIYTLIWMVKSYCGISTDTITVNYIPKPITTFTLNDTLICAGTTIQPTNTTANIGLYQFQWEFGNGAKSSLTHPNSILFAPSVSGADTTYPITLFAYTACDTMSATQNITVRKKPQASLQIATNENCFPITANFTISKIQNAETYMFLYGDGKKDTLFSSTSFTNVYTGDSTQNYYPKLIVSNSCGIDSASTIVSANQKPILEFIRVPDSVCSGSLAQIKIGSSIPTVKYHWASKQLVASDSSTNSYSVINNSFQPTILKDSVYAISTAGCKSNTLDTAFSVLPQATKAKTGNDTVICISNTIIFNGNTPSVGLGKWQQLSGASTTQSTNNNQLQIGNLTPGIYQFQWNISNYCSSTADTVEIQFMPKPAPSFELSDTTVCGATAIQIQHTTPNQTLYRYQWDFGNGVYSSDTNPASIHYFPAVGNNDTSYTISLVAYTNCDSIKVEKQVTVKKKPIAALQIVPDTNCFPITANITVSKPLNLDSYLFLYGDGKIDSTFTATHFSYNYTGDGVQTYYPKLFVANACGIDSATAIISANPSPFLQQITTLDSVCSGASATIQLSSSINDVLYYWGSKQLVPSNNNANSYAILNNTQANSIVTDSVYAISSAGCKSNTLNTSFVVVPSLSIAHAGNDTSICSGTSLQLHATQPLVGSGQWKQISGPSTILFNDSTNPKTTIQNIQVGAYSLLWSVINYCGSSTDTLLITSIPTPVAQFTISDTLICAGTTIQLTNTTNNSSAYQFKWDFGNGTYSNSPQPNPILFAPAISGADTSYTISLFAFTNCDTISFSKKITVRKKPILQFVAVPDSICTGSNSKIQVASSINNVKYYWGSKQLTPSDSSINTYLPTNNGTQNISIHDSVYAISAGGCKSNTLDTSFIVIPNATKAITANDTTICSSTNLVFNGNIPTVGNGIWQQLSSSASVQINNHQLQISNPTPGLHQFEWRISNYCSSSADTITIRFTPTPAPNFNIPAAIVCNPDSVHIQNTTPNSSIYNYKWNFGNGTYSYSPQPNPILFAPSNSGADTSYTITLIAYSTCDSIKIEKQIIVKKKPVSYINIELLNTCLPLQIKFKSTVAGVNTNTRIFWGDGSDSSLTNNSEFIHTYFGNTNTVINPYLVAQNSCGTDTAFEFINAIANNLSVANNLRDTSVCGLPFQLSIQNNTTGANTQHWNWGDGHSSVNNNTTLTHSYTKPGVYAITNTISHVCGDTIITKKIKLNAKPTASINTVPTNTCIGDTVELTTNIDSSLHYEWFINNQLVDSVAHTKYAFTMAGNYNPLLQVMNTANGFSCSDTTSTPIIIVAEKPGKASINPTNGFCVPFNLQLISKSLPATSVTWYMGNDSSIQGDTANYTYTTGGEYLVKMKAIATGGCTYTDSATVTIRSPQGKIIIPSTRFCGASATATFLPTVDFTDRIAWNFGDGTLVESTVQAQSHQYKKPGIYHPSATLISNTGCSIPILLDSIIIEDVQAAFAIKTIYECGNTVFNFMDSSYSSSGISLLTWKTDNRFIGNGSLTTTSFGITGTHTTQLIATGKYGCTDTIAGTYHVQIYNLPKVNINAINEACLNSLMELKSEISSIDSVILRLWNLGNGKIGTDSAVRILYYDQGKYTVRLTVATINKCYDSALKQITIHPVPEVKVAGPEKICVGETVELKAAGANNFVWKDQQDNIICNNCLTIKVKPIRSTQYKVIGYNEFGCTQVNSANVQVIDKPKLNIIPEDTICTGESTRLWVSGAAHYQWLPAAGLNNYSSATPTATPTTTTSYKVVGRDINNCFTDTAWVRVVVGNPTPITVGRDSNFVAGSKIQLRATASSADIIRWKWSGGSDLSCVNCPNPIARVVFDECIRCAATNRYGCTTNDTVCFKTFCPTTEVFIPNAFTPDGDGVNDQFFVQAKGIRTIKSLRIFNRWGEVVFEKTNVLPNDAASGWNGKVRGVTANPDVYVYICEVICEKGGTQMYKGNVAIIK
jgi:gliding motility-associated-like protein